MRYLRQTTAKKSSKSILKRIKNGLIKIIIGFIIITMISVLLLRFINPLGSMLMVERKLANWNTPQQRIWKESDEISDNIKMAVIASEDQNFATHFGFDFSAIKRAINYNQKYYHHQKPVHGASTITQQVAKNIFLWSSRSYIRKIFEAWFTIWIEILWSKERTLEIYLNSVEWGEGIFGIEAASRHYFNTTAKNLTIEQATLLAALLPNPRKWSPNSPFVQRKAAWIRLQISNLGGKRYLQRLH